MVLLSGLFCFILMKHYTQGTLMNSLYIWGNQGLQQLRGLTSHTANSSGAVFYAGSSWAQALPNPLKCSSSQRAPKLWFGVFVEVAREERRECLSFCVYGWQQKAAHHHHLLPGVTHSPATMARDTEHTDSPCWNVTPS